MSPGDILVYYSPVQRLGDKTALRHFTALGVIADDEIWQADEGDFRPFRRRVHYEATRAVPLEEVKAHLALTSTPHWGYQLRRGAHCAGPRRCQGAAPRDAARRGAVTRAEQ